MRDKYLVSEVAKFFEVSKDTIRYYDKVGIIKPDKNSETQYRYYSREDLISFSYVFLLKELGLSLKDIGTLLNHNSLDVSMSILNKRKEEIENTIKKLNMIKDMIDDYNKLNIYTRNSLNDFHIDDNVLIIYQEINKNKSFNMNIKQFEDLGFDKIPLFTFCFDKEVFNSDEFENAMTSKYKGRFALSIRIDKDAALNKEMSKDILIFNPERCLVTTILCRTNKDYSSFARLKKLLHENSLTEDGMVLFRAVSFRNNIYDNQDYYEVFIPIK